jgi:hypothetical protein
MEGGFIGKATAGAAKAKVVNQELKSSVTEGLRGFANKEDLLLLRFASWGAGWISRAFQAERLWQEKRQRGGRAVWNR